MPDPAQKIQLEFHQLKNILIKRFGQEYHNITLSSRIDFAPACELSFILKEISLQESRLGLFWSFYLNQHVLEGYLHRDRIFLNQLYDYQDLLDVIRYLCILFDTENGFDKQAYFQLKRHQLKASFSQLEAMYIHQFDNIKRELNALPELLNGSEFRHLLSLVKEHMAWYASKLIIHRLLTWLCTTR